ncbi:MAG TPA: amidase [Burkholderiales bacterium]|nr:amidase [Burkholderiales bacterium]
MKALELSLAEAADGLARGEFSSVDLTSAAIARLQEVQPKVNCLARLDEGDALKKAESADRERKQGKARGALHGVPLAHKDLFYVRGKVVACGSKIRRDFVPDTTATVLERLDAAGAINVGALHMAEFAMSPTGYNEHYGHCRNPWNTDHVPGGSSSGSGAAVAARAVFGSLGTDTGGSIRHPASMCGLTGLKPTTTRVSRAGAMPLSFSLDCVGPLARTARDCARIMEVIAGADPLDPTASSEPVPRYEAGLDGNVRGLKIGVARDYFYDPVPPEIAKRLDESLAALRSLGAQIVEVGVPDMALINTLMHVLMTVEGATIHRKWLATRRDDYSDQVRSRFEPGLFYPATRYLEALSLRASVAREFVDTVLKGVDVLHLPAVPIPVPTIDESTTGPNVSRTIGLIGHCMRGLNYVGLPSIGVPAGFDGRKMPTGFQLVGRPFTEATLLRAADAYQRVTDWHKRKP